MSRTGWIVVLVCGMVGAPAMTSAQQVPAAPRLATATGDEVIPLRPRTATSGDKEQPDTAPNRATGQALSTIVGGLAVCLGAFFLFVWVTRRHAPSGSTLLPREVMESLGRLPFNGRQNLQLIRVGRKLVVLHVSVTGATPLTEITDPAEVDHLLGLCQQNRPSSVTASFREALTHFEREPAAKGFLGEARTAEWELAARDGRRRHGRQEDLDE